jgi:ABC-type transporter Mla MlaB component
MNRPSVSELQSRELVLKGELVLQRITALKDELQAALAEVDQLLLNLSEASAFDLSFLQLLCSGHRSAVQLNKSLKMSGTFPEGFHQELREAGFVRHVGCGLDCQDSCIWMGLDE